MKRDASGNMNVVVRSQGDNQSVTEMPCPDSVEFKPKWMLCEVSLFKTLSLESWQREAIVSEEATFIFREFGEFGQEGAVFHCPWGTVKPQVGSTPLPAHPAYH